MKNRWVIGVLAACGAVGALVLWALRDRPVDVETVRAATGLWEEVVEDDGRARVRERIVVTMPWAGELQRSSLREGQWVAPGQPLLAVAPPVPVLRDRRTQAELDARAAAAQAAWQRAARQTEASLVAWQRSLLTAARIASLAEEGFVSPAQVEGAALDLQRDERQWQVARQAERVALHELEQARVAGAAGGAVGVAVGGGVGSAVESAVGSASGPLRSLTTRTEVQVLKVLQPHATTLAAGVPVLEVGDPRNPEVVVPLLSQEALGLRVGGLARLSAWKGSGPMESADEPGFHEGRIRVVEPAATTKVSALGLEEQRVNVVIDPLRPLPPGDGYALRVQLVRDRREGVLRVPVSALFPMPGAAGLWAVFVVDGERVRLRSVQAPAQARAGADGWVWISAGVEAGTEVVVFPPASLADGKTVRIRRR